MSSCEIMHYVLKNKTTIIKLKMNIILPEMTMKKIQMGWELSSKNQFGKPFKIIKTMRTTINLSNIKVRSKSIVRGLILSCENDH